MGAIKIFKMNDCDWVAASNVKDALTCLAGITDVYEENVPIELTKDELDSHFVTEEEDNDDVEKTFRQKLKEMIANGEDFPQMPLRRTINKKGDKKWKSTTLL